MYTQAHIERQTHRARKNLMDRVLQGGRNGIQSSSAANRRDWVEWALAYGHLPRPNHM